MEDLSKTTKISKINSDIVSTSSSCYCCLKVSGAMLSSFIYIALILFPWIAEIILVKHQTNEHAIITLIVCGVLQTILSLYGGFKMGSSWVQNVNAAKTNNKLDCSDIWCECPFNYKSLLSAGYVIYFLPQWVVTNMIISWVLVQIVSLPVYAHIMVYMPLLAYFPALFVGCAYSYSITNNAYTQIV